MLFITYWELSEDVPVAETLQAAQKLVAAGLYPPTDAQIIRWDITPDRWGISIVEADSAQAVSDALTVWRAAVPGIFKCTKTSPAIPVAESMPLTGQLLQKLASS